MGYMSGVMDLYMIVSELKVGDYYLCKNGKVSIIYQIWDQTDYPVIVSFANQQLLVMTKEGRLWKDHESSKDLDRKITKEDNPEYFV